MFPLNPPVDLYETKDFYVLNVEVPGVDVNEVHVEVRGSRLTIWGERKVDACCSDENYHRIEGMRGRFHRTFSLPKSIEENCPIQATLKNGVLHVELAKSGRNIAIGPGESR
jgi:HSP20 family protein